MRHATCRLASASVARGPTNVRQRRRRQSTSAVRDRIAAACRGGRDAAEVTLVAVTKTYPASDVVLLAGLGVTDVGENRDQEAAPKAAAVAADGRTGALALRRPAAAQQVPFGGRVRRRGALGRQRPAGRTRWRAAAERHGTGRSTSWSRSASTATRPAAARCRRRRPIGTPVAAGVGRRRGDAAAARADGGRAAGLGAGRGRSPAWPTSPRGSVPIIRRDGALRRHER